MVRRVLVLAGSLAVAAAACTSSDGGSSGNSASLIVGIQSQSFGALVGSFHIVVKRSGIVVTDQTVAVGSSTPTPGGLPKEIPIEGARGERIDVQVDGVAANGGAPVVSRLATSHLVPGKKLLRLNLEAACALVAPVGAPPPASCAAPLTCIFGRCASSEILDGDLEDYDPRWADAPPDICRPAKHGAPELTTGLGQLDYGTLVDEQVVQLEEGPQGGHHVWIAVRMKNLLRSGSTTMITGRILDDPGLAVPPAAFVFTFDPDEGNYCKLYGLRFQIDAGAQDLVSAYKPFLGKRLEVTVTVTDAIKESATSTKIIHLGDTLICRDGGDACNQR